MVNNGTAWTCGALAENEIAQFCYGRRVRRLQTESRGSGGGSCEAILALKSVPITILRRRRRTPPGLLVEVVRVALAVAALSHACG